MMIQPRVSEPAVMILMSALDVIRREAFQANGVETGGILAGVKTSNGAILITHATAPGPNARHAAASFQADVDYQQKILDKLMRHFGVDYRGEWHRHPGRMSRPSGPDLRGVRGILADRDYGIDSIVFPIVTCNRREGFRAFPYVMSREQGEFCAIDWQIIPFWLAPDVGFIRNPEELLPAKQLGEYRKQSWLEMLGFKSAR